MTTWSSPTLARSLARPIALTDLTRAERLPHGTLALPKLARPEAGTAILDVTKWFGETSGGVKTYLLEKARWVEAHPAVRQTLVIPGPFDSVSVGDGTRVYRLRGPRIPGETAYRFLLAPRSLRRIVQHERPHIIEVGSPIFVPWITKFAARGLQVPIVQFHHMSLRAAWSALGHVDMPGALGRALLGAWARRLDRLVDRTIVASHSAAQELAAAGLSRVSRVPLGVDLAHFHPARRMDRERTLRRLGLPPDCPLVLYVGRFAPEKRLDVLLAAWRTVEKRTGAHLALVGEGAAEAVLRADQRATRVSWLPYLHDREILANLIAAADVVVAPGDSETFGLAPLEGLASGVPVVSSACGAVAELVTGSGTGALFSPGDGADCARAIEATLALDMQEAGHQARGFAEREHDWNRVFDALHHVYREVIDAAAARHS